MGLEPQTNRQRQEVQRSEACTLSLSGSTQGLLSGLRPPSLPRRGGEVEGLRVRGIHDPRAAGQPDSRTAGQPAPVAWEALVVYSPSPWRPDPSSPSAGAGSGLCHAPESGSRAPGGKPSSKGVLGRGIGAEGLLRVSHYSGYDPSDQS